jgi:C4-dicarboxylate-binding protein DctP
MKKRSGLSCLVVLTLASMMALAGCGNSASNAAADGKSSQGASPAEAAYPKMEIKLSHVAADNTPKGQAALKFKEIVESKSGGNIKVKVFPSGQLYGDNDEIEALQANNVQIIAPSAAKLSGFDKSFEIFDLPFMFKDEESLRRFEDGEGGKKLLSKLESKGIEGLSFWPNGFKHITNKKVAIKSPDDLKGLKIRTHGGQIINEVYEKLGAASTKIAFNEVYQALQLGTIDGQENSLVNIETQKYEEVQNNLTLTNHARSEYVVVANKKWWDSLDAKTQSLLDEAMKEATEVGRDLVQKLELESLEKIKKNGKMKVTELTDQEREAFKQAVQPVFDKWAAEMDPEVINLAKEASK